LAKTKQPNLCDLLCAGWWANLGF